MSCVFQNIDPPPPSPPGQCVPPPLLRVEDTLARGRMGWGGGSIFCKTQDIALYSTYIESSLASKFLLRPLRRYDVKPNKKQHK
jgi:hypothetical protein